MFLNIVHFGYFVFFGSLNVTIGHTFLGETGSDISLVIKFSDYPLSCKELKICFISIQGTLSSVYSYYRDDVMTISDHGLQFISTFGQKYENRIFNVSINFPTNVNFSLRNASVRDSGLYYATNSKCYFFISESELFGTGILLVSDQILRTCTSKQIGLDFVLPLSALNEQIAVMFYTGTKLSSAILSICNPEAGTCAPPSSSFSRLEIRVNGSSISITLNSVQMTDQGMYALIGSTSEIIYQSAILNVTQCLSNAGIPLNTSELPNITTGYSSVGNTGISHSQIIISSAVPSADHWLVIHGKYFVGGSAVTGIVLVTLACRFLWKRLRRNRQNHASGDYDTVDVHYYSTIRSQHQCDPESVAKI